MCVCVGARERGGRERACGTAGCHACISAIGERNVVSVSEREVRKKHIAYFCACKLKIKSAYVGEKEVRQTDRERERKRESERNRNDNENECNE